ncbi:MAG: hypothetical protein ISR58_07305 [Anaerolineales bacterium]|nr:hypothetical protein [Chloroflexota bacterium]MBL6980983.1 hypothetical protein [Anaerolineales bacterium]
MIKNYTNALTRAIEHRQKLKIPALNTAFLAANFFLIVYVVIALYVSPKDNLERHFQNENGAITALSSIALAMACGFAGTSYSLSKTSIKAKKLFWLILSIAFGFFSLDLLLEVHEEFGKLLSLIKIVPKSAFRNWNDIVIILYGAMSILFFIYFLPVLLSYPKLIELIGLALVFYIIHTAIDLFLAKTSTSIIIEETFKLFSAAYLTGAMYFGLRGNIFIYSSSENE